MTFKQYRNNLSNNARLKIALVDGKNLKHFDYVNADFDENIVYSLDCYKVKINFENYGLNIFNITLTK